MAIEEAYIGIKNDEGGPFGTIIVKNGIVISKGHNQVLKLQDATCHGEIQAIRNASKSLKTYDLSGCELYSTAEPCPMCLGAILWSNISKVYYGCDILDTEMIGFRDNLFYNLNEDIKKSLMQQLERDKCLRLYDDYLKQNKKNAY